MRPGQRFGAVGLPTVVDDTELEEPARSEQLHALEGFAVRCLIQLHEWVFARRPVGRDSATSWPTSERGSLISACSQSTTPTNYWSRKR